MPRVLTVLCRWQQLRCPLARTCSARYIGYIANLEPPSRQILSPTAHLSLPRSPPYRPMPMSRALLHTSTHLKPRPARFTYVPILISSSPRPFDPTSFALVPGYPASLSYEGGVKHVTPLTHGDAAGGSPQPAQVAHRLLRAGLCRRRNRAVVCGSRGHGETPCCGARGRSP